MPSGQLSRLVWKLKTLDAYLGVLSKRLRQKMEIDCIRCSIKQLVHHFNPKKQSQLIASVEKHDILEPLLVYPLRDIEFNLVVRSLAFKVQMKCVTPVYRSL